MRGALKFALLYMPRRGGGGELAPGMAGGDHESLVRDVVGDVADAVRAAGQAA